MTGAFPGLRRHFPVAVSAEALALAWARQEAAPTGATITVDHEISPRGRLGRLWQQQAEQTAILAMVWRPNLAAAAADLVWSAASLGLLRAIEDSVDLKPKLRWPDEVVDESGQLLGAVRAEMQLGPGRVTSAIVTARVDLARIGWPERSCVRDALDTNLAMVAAQLDSEPDTVRAACNAASAIVGWALIAHILPRGEVRGTVEGVDANGALAVVSPTGLRQLVPLVGLDRLTVTHAPD